MPHKKIGTTSAEKKSPKRHIDEYSETMRNEVPTNKSMASFVPKPKKLIIDIQAEDEDIILLLRQHVVTQVKWIVTAIIMLFLPLLFSFMPIFSFLPTTYQFASLLGWYLLTAGFAIESYLKWFYRVYLITDERIIDVDFISMIHKDISTTKIDKIEDITALTTGLFSSIFNYGTVTVQTAATKQEFGFKNIPQPSKVVALLNEMILEEELEKFEGRVK